MATVSAPPLRPPTYGLIVAARDAAATDGPDFRFDQHGIKWTPAACETNNLGPGPDICDVSDQGALTAEPCEDASFRPVVLRAGRPVSTFGPDAAVNEARVRALLEATQSWQLAKEVWAGAVTQSSGSDDLDNPYFTKSGASTTVSGPVAVATAAAVLDDALGDCLHGARGMIHVTPKALGLLVAATAVVRVGNLWLSPMGNVVVADAGYDGTGPSAASAGNEWAFATGLVEVRLDQVYLTADVKGRMNLRELRAERLAAAAWDPCCLLALQIDTTP